MSSFFFANGTDRIGNEFFFVNPNGTAHVNITAVKPRELSHFSNRRLHVPVRTTSSFSTDLTARDDVLLAVLALLLLFVIKDIASTILLRTRKGKVSKFAFHVRQCVDLIEDFNFRYLFTGRRGTAIRWKNLNLFLIFTASAVLLATFGLEAGVLILTDPSPRKITNEEATIRIIGPTLAHWEEIRFNVRTALYQQCRSVTLRRVDQGETRINSCINTDLSPASVGILDTLAKVDVNITTNVHEFGYEHYVKFGEHSTLFSQRAFFTLADQERRIMRHRSGYDHSDMPVQIEIVHRQFIAFLCSDYKKSAKDDTMTLERLRSFDFDYRPNIPGPNVVITKGRDGLVVRPSTRYTTLISEELPVGTQTLHFAQALFRGSIAIGIKDVDEGDVGDLVEGKGMLDTVSVIWTESYRIINWLTLLLLLASMFAFLLVLRVVMNPTSTSEIAWAFVRNAVQANWTRSPVQLSDKEKRFFRVYDEVYSLGTADSDAEKDDNEYSIGDSSRRLTDAGSLSLLTERGEAGYCFGAETSEGSRISEDYVKDIG